MKETLDSRYWDSVIEKKSSGVLEKNVALYYKSEHVRLIERWAGSLRGKKTLKTDLFEEATANGDFLSWIAYQGAQAYGMDISMSIARKSRARNAIASDVRRCAFKDRSFDLIVSNSTLDNLEAKDVGASLGELYRILKPEGLLILTLDNACNPLYYLGYLLEKILRSNRYFQGRCYSLQEAKDLAASSGFFVQDATAIVHLPTPFNKIALLLSGIFRGYMDPPVRFFINFFSGAGAKKTRFRTGWFIALKLAKIEKSRIL